MASLSGAGDAWLINIVVVKKGNQISLRRPDQCAYIIFLPLNSYETDFSDTESMKFVLIIQQRLWSKMQIALKFRPTVLTTSTVFTSWNFPNLKTFIRNEQTMEADCKKQAKNYIYMQIIII